MIRYCLQTIYSTRNIGFDHDLDLATGISLVRECKIPTIKFKTTGTADNGKTQVKGQAVEKVYQGNPLLLRIAASSDFNEGTNPLEARTRLEQATNKVVSQFNWSFPESIEHYIDDCLLKQDTYQKNKTLWDWHDVSPIRVGGFNDSPEKMISDFQSTQQHLSIISSDRRNAVDTALRWWHYSQSPKDLVDQFIALWIVLETTASELCNEDHIGSRVKSTLKILYPTMCSSSDDSSITRMKKLLYKTRCSAVHSGTRDIEDIYSLTELQREVSKACIEYLLHNQTSSEIKQELRQNLNI